MARILSKIARFFSVKPRLAPAGDTADVAGQLMERALVKSSPHIARDDTNGYGYF